MTDRIITRRGECSPWDACFALSRAFDRPPKHVFQVLLVPFNVQYGLNDAVRDGNKQIKTHPGGPEGFRRPRPLARVITCDLFNLVRTLPAP
jgi:hypothetical protein